MQYITLFPSFDNLQAIFKAMCAFSGYNKTAIVSIKGNLLQITIILLDLYCVGFVMSNLRHNQGMFCVIWRQGERRIMEHWQLLQFGN